ncbi:MAG TPA: virulence factor [Ilumatobacteraceae bacterium]|nr:virulence factor [Ilumatobacteraceae bacterium]
MPRGSKRPELVTIYWRDIPAQVNAQLGRERHQVLLSDKFQRAVDRAKRKAHIYTAHEDIAQWRRESQPCEGDLATAAEALAGQLEKAYTRDRLGLLAFAGGFEADVGADRVRAAELAALEELDEDDAAEQDASASIETEQT